MRILVFPHSMEVGGSQKNAIDLATALVGRGHDVVVFGPDGELVDVLRERGLTYRPAPTPRLRPSPAVMRRLSEVVRAEHIDIVHAFEWPPTIDAVYGPLVRLGTPVVCTIMSMAVAPFIPARLPMTVGTEAIAAVERRRRPRVTVLEPPVDTLADRPIDPAASRLAHGIEASELLVVVVSRLVEQLKLEGILAATRAAATLATHLPVRLLVAGDGPARPEVESAAVRVNAAAGREVVTLTGNLADPRSLYDAADIVLGMGGSALRAMAFGKPLVVQGERGFWRLLEPASLPAFLERGWYGIGDGQDGAPALGRILAGLADAPRERARLGEFGRQTVHARYSLTAAAASMEALYEEVRAAPVPPGRTLPGLASSFAAVTRHDLRHKIARRLGRAAAEDFNTLNAMTRTSRGTT
ncbi:MAG: glycosyltransferase [Georgenia sp.]